MRQFYRFLISDGSRAGRPDRRSRFAPSRSAPAENSQPERGRSADRGRSEWPGEEGVRLRVHPRAAVRDRAARLGAGRLPLAAMRRDPRFLVVRGKGGKERVVPLSEPARRALAEYLECRTGFSRSRSRRLQGGALAVSVARRRRSSDAAALRPTAQGTGAEGRARSGPAVAACAAPRLRQPSARRRRRSAQRAADARPCRHRDDADLYACPGRAAAPAGRDRAPSRAPEG